MPILEVTMSYSPLAFLYAFSTPTITINETRDRRPWGTYRFELPPGNYRVEMSYPWLISPECGKNSVDIVLREGDHKHVRYTARMLRYWPGRVSVDDVIPTARALRDRST
ncbi:MAG TPA: hypothetical protein VF516_20225 [Kofleriaceae bacterium]